MVLVQQFFFVIYPLIELPSPRLRKFKVCDFVEKWKTPLQDSIIIHSIISFNCKNQSILKPLTKRKSRLKQAKEAH